MEYQEISMEADCFSVFIHMCSLCFKFQDQCASVLGYTSFLLASDLYFTFYDGFILHYKRQIF